MIDYMFYKSFNIAMFTILNSGSVSHLVRLFYLRRKLTYLSTSLSASSSKNSAFKFSGKSDSIKAL